MRPARDGIDVRVPLREATLVVHVNGIPAWSCSKCDDYQYDAEPLQRAELIAARAVVDGGFREGAAVRFVRKALGLRAVGMAQLLGVAPETVSRWENDKSPIDVSAWIALGALINDRLSGTDETERRLRAGLVPATSFEQIDVEYHPRGPGTAAGAKFIAFDAVMMQHLSVRALTSAFTAAKSEMNAFFERELTGCASGPANEAMDELPEEEIDEVVEHGSKEALS